ncbi:sugar phosphate isomerase/epimerase [candidate division KSB1 bacterium]|nr:sugar phosphate isomerase/epimerase [candidate division KSB1 bacterium]
MKKLQLGLIVGLSDDPQQSFEYVHDVDVPTCQLSCVAEYAVENLDPEQVLKASEATGVAISSCFLLFEGQKYNLADGPDTMGLVAPAHQQRRLRLAKEFSDLVREMGVNSITCHVGFIPDDPRDSRYIQFIEVMKEVAEYCGENDQIFCFETGQELPSTLLRAMHDVNTGNLYINLDPANLILYGMANPLDAIEIFGEYVRGMHAKDGVWPNRNESLGLETPLGEGKVNFGLLLPRLKAKGFSGPVTIEREIRGPQQRVDILKAKKFLDPYL